MDGLDPIGFTSFTSPDASPCLVHHMLDQRAARAALQQPRHEQRQLRVPALPCQHAHLWAQCNRGWRALLRTHTDAHWCNAGLGAPEEGCLGAECWLIKRRRQHARASCGSPHSRASTPTCGRNAIEGKDGQGLRGADHREGRCMASSAFVEACLPPPASNAAQRR
jgi:hypothetical protein